MITRSPKTFSTDPLFQLDYSSSGPSPIVLRRIPDMTASVGANGAQFDEMLRRWVGGSGITNTFWLMGVPAGTYDLYLYTGSTVTTIFTIMVNGGTYHVATATPTGVAAFTLSNNYVKFSNLVVPATVRAFKPVMIEGGMIEIKVEGTLSGLQLKRL